MRLIASHRSLEDFPRKKKATGLHDENPFPSRNVLNQPKLSYRGGEGRFPMADEKLRLAVGQALIARAEIPQNTASRSILDQKEEG